MEVHRQEEPARIEIGFDVHAGATVFFVRDNGTGFDMSHAGKLFVPFQSLHAPGEYPGTRIGLATSRQIVESHGGRIWAEGLVDGGATFFFSFPPGDRQSTRIHAQDDAVIGREYSPLKLGRKYARAHDAP